MTPPPLEPRPWPHFTGRALPNALAYGVLAGGVALYTGGNLPGTLSAEPMKPPIHYTAPSNGGTAIITVPFTDTAGALTGATTWTPSPGTRFEFP